MQTLFPFLMGAGAMALIVWWASRRIGFAVQRPAHYAATGPQFDLRRHLNGPIQCEGVIFGPLGRVTSRFVAQMEARWDGDVGVMTERFRYDSGALHDREWRLTLANDGSVRAEADDLVGTGHGMQSGASVQLAYTIRLPQADGGHVLQATDWMYLAENGVIINRSQFRKYGFKVAELVATMRPGQVA